MRNTMTTTKLSGFRVDDITYHGARRQSEIENEIEHEEVVEEEVKAPVSLTPEQIKEFHKKKRMLLVEFLSQNHQLKQNVLIIINSNKTL